MANTAHVYCIFGWRTGEDSPELLTAWDEYSVDQNPDGWREEFERVASDNAIHPRWLRVARLVVDWDKVEALYHDVEIGAELEPERA